MSVSSDAEQFMAELDHPLKEGVVGLRRAILAADPGITEHVKWNAPSFRYAGDSASFAFDDPGLMRWATPDRRILTFSDLEEVESHTAAVGALAGRWVVA